MNQLTPSYPSIIRPKIHRTLLFFLVLLGLVFSGMNPVSADHISDADVEQFVRAKIDLGESMGNFFRGMRSPSFGPDGGAPDMEAMRKLETKINNHVADVLSEHGLTIEEYRGRGPEIFEDTEAVNRFLEDHPDLRERFERLPQSPRRGRR